MFSCMLTLSIINDDGKGLRISIDLALLRLCSYSEGKKCRQNLLLVFQKVSFHPTQPPLLVGVLTLRLNC